MENVEFTVSYSNSDIAPALSKKRTIQSFQSLARIAMLHYNSINKTIKTPELNHVRKSDWDFVYEPAEDSFLLLDALEQDLEFLHAKKPAVVLEVGSGSGIIITALDKVFNCLAYSLAVDINSHACKLTKSTANYNKAVVDVIQTDLTSCLRESSVDMIIFNPPYVVTPKDEISSDNLLAKSWAGGTDGAEVINRFLATFANKMRPRSFGYILVLKENQCENILRKLQEQLFECEIFFKRKIRGEELFVIKFKNMN